MSSAITGGYGSLAAACGERDEPLVFIPGEDFDPDDPDEVEAVGLAMDNDMASQIKRLTDENARLRSLVEDSNGGMVESYIYPDEYDDDW